jgi:DNA replication and repair protein RecF
VIFQAIRTVFFRNLADGEFCTGGKDVFLVGENGQGKTNFLEALYFAAYGSSFRGAHDGELARNGEKDYGVQVKLTSAAGEDAGLYQSELQIKYERGKKSVILD